MEIGLIEVPEVVVRLVKKVETVQPLDPPYAHIHVFVIPIDLGSATSNRVRHLVHTNGVFLWDHFPIIRLAIDARNGVGWKLEDFELNTEPLNRKSGTGENSEQESCV